MAFDPTKHWPPAEWQAHVNDLLRVRHGDDDYITIPDLHTGDSGIEGFSINGNAYQSYSPDQMCKSADLALKQKIKITTDIRKFIKNKDKLDKLFDQTKIRRWILVVPRQVSQEVVIHANQKAKEVRSQNLPYVESEHFRILVKDRQNFKVEEKTLIDQGIHKLKLDEISVTTDEVDNFESDQHEFIQNITSKLAKLSTSTDDNIYEAKCELIKRFIVSENILQRLQEDYPEYYERIQTLRHQREHDLKLEALSNEAPSLTDQVDRFLPRLESYGKLHLENNKAIAWGSISDWLMRCPLDFA